MSELKSIPINAITMIDNYRDTEPVDEKDPAIMELASDIKDKGVLQPILVRPDKKKKDHYQLIFGHRRFVASKLGGLMVIPATVKEVQDDEILELQVTENLHRKDVHPMDEAKAFKAWKEKNKCEVKELAVKFAKSERYIVQRLSLNNLIPDIQKDFLAKKLSIIQAEVFAKITPEQQKELKKSTCWNGTYHRSADDMKGHIERHFLHKLDAVPWKLDDANLVPAAGSCKDCKKRTGCQAMLFADVVRDDRCMDGACFNGKLKTHIEKKATEVMNNHPEIVLLTNRHGEVNKKILQEAKSLGVKVLESFDDFYENKSTYNNFIQPQKGFWVSGNNAGKMATVYIKKAKSSSAKSKPSQSNLKELIAGIEERCKRSEELDYEKVMAQVREKVMQFIGDNKPFDVDFSARMEGVVWYILYDMVGYMNQEILEELMLEDSHDEWEEDPKAMIEAMLKLTPRQKANILVCAFTHKYGLGSTARKGPEAYMLREIATWLGVDIASIEEAQNAIAAKRLANAQKRIEALKKQASEKPAKKRSASPEEKKVTKKKAAKKK